MMRRDVLQLAGGLMMVAAPVAGGGRAKSAGSKPSLISAPLQLAGTWDDLPADVIAVLSRARDACLSGLALRSDRQVRES